MARYSKKTGVPRTEIMRQALEFFGLDELGLEVNSLDAYHAIFEGGGGHIYLQVIDKVGNTEVRLETQEWDYQTQQFLKQL